MFLVLPVTSAIHPASYLAPQSYGYYPSHGYYPHHEVPRFSVAPYLSQPRLFHPPLVGELEDHEYRRALAVVVSHRRRQAEREAAIRQQQLAEVVRQVYLTTCAAELEHQRQEEMLQARCVEFIRSREARARPVAAERQHAPNALSHLHKGPHSVCHFLTQAM